jgi:predicted nucleic acid-binding protein
VSKSLLDTDILSEILKNRNPLVAARATAYRSSFGHYTISCITVMEVVCGYKRALKLDLLNTFLARLASVEVLPFSTGTAELAGLIDADLQSSGQIIGRADPMIAAIAIEHRLTLVTGNTDHFSRITDLGYELQLDNWRHPADTG